MKTLTVLTYNLWHGLNPTSPLRFAEYETADEREGRLQGFLAQARKIDADIIFLQEVNPAPGLSKRIAHELGYDHAFQIDNAGIKIGAVGLPTNLRSGLAILAKNELDLRDLGGRKLSGPAGGCTRTLSLQISEFRYVQAASVTINGHRVLLLNTHLHHGLEVTPEILNDLQKLVAEGKITQAKMDEIVAGMSGSSARRQSELERAIEFARSQGFDDSAVIFAGDFNATPDAPELSWLTGQFGFRSSTGEHDGQTDLFTWDPLRNPNTQNMANFEPANVAEGVMMSFLKQKIVQDRRRIDYIFHRKMDDFAEVEESGLFGDQLFQGRMCSDHFGIFARFSLKP